MSIDTISGNAWACYGNSSSQGPSPADNSKEDALLWVEEGKMVWASAVPCLLIQGPENGALPLCLHEID